MNSDEPNTIEASLEANNLKFGIVCSRFNDGFVRTLLSGAIDAIVQHGGRSDDIDVVWVPGAYEIPLLAKKLASSAKYDAVIALGVVIQGATPHAHYINTQVSHNLAAISLSTGIPVTFGIITADNREQVIERTGGKNGNRGVGAAEAAIEMACLLKQLA